MEKLQTSCYSILQTTSLASSVFSFLQPSSNSDKTPLGGILSGINYGWLSLGIKFCVVDLKSGSKVARLILDRGNSGNSFVTSVAEIPTPLAPQTQQVVISQACGNKTGIIYVFNIVGSQLLHCVRTNVVITKLSLCDYLPLGPFSCFDGVVMAGTMTGQLVVFDLNRRYLKQALDYITQGKDHVIHGKYNPAKLIFLPLKSLYKIKRERDDIVVKNDNIAVVINEDCFVGGNYIFLKSDGTEKMRSKLNDVKVTALMYLPHSGTLAVGFNFGVFQLWNILEVRLEYTSDSNDLHLPVTHFGLQEMCKDPADSYYLWVVFSVLERFKEEKLPVAVMYSLSYRAKRMLTEKDGLYEDLSTAIIGFQMELGAVDKELTPVGGKCISCHTYPIKTILGRDDEYTMFNMCQLIWECWEKNHNNMTQHCMLLFNIDQWYKEQRPATELLGSKMFMAKALGPELAPNITPLDIRLDPTTVSLYSHTTRLEEHFYPKSLQYSYVCLNTAETTIMQTEGVQGQILRYLWETGPSCLLQPAELYAACISAGLTPLFVDTSCVKSAGDQRRFLLSLALEARQSQFLKSCVQNWATDVHSGVGCTLKFLADWCWTRTVDLKENATHITTPLFTESIGPDKEKVRHLEYCVQQLGAITNIMDAILTKSCNLIVPEVVREMEERKGGIDTIALYFRLVQWLLRVRLLPEGAPELPYPLRQLQLDCYQRRLQLHRLQEPSGTGGAGDSREVLYIDRLIEYWFGKDKLGSSWRRAGDKAEVVANMYPPPSLHALTQLYLRRDVHEDHKNEVLLYLLLDYNMIYDETRYAEVTFNLKQFPSLFGLSDTIIKTTEAFWHLDHLDFDAAVYKLQYLNGNILSGWQHQMVLTNLMAYKQYQFALQYLHSRQPPPTETCSDESDLSQESSPVEDWQTSCTLYLARGLVFEALEMIRTCVNNASAKEEKIHFLNFFYKGCRKTGQLSEVLQMYLVQFEEELFIKYLKEADNANASNILVLYYLQKSRYLEAKLYIAQTKTFRYHQSQATRQISEFASNLVDASCSSVPHIAAEVARVAALPMQANANDREPITVSVQANSSDNSPTAQSSFIQKTIASASETWTNKPLKSGVKRTLSIEETPFICPLKISKSLSSLSASDTDVEATQRKKANAVPLQDTPTTLPRVSESITREVDALLQMPEVRPPVRLRRHIFNKLNDRPTDSNIINPHSPTVGQRPLSMNAKMDDPRPPPFNPLLGWTDSGRGLNVQQSPSTSGLRRRRYSDYNYEISAVQRRFSSDADASFSHDSTPVLATPVRISRELNSDDADDEIEDSLQDGRALLPPNSSATMSVVKKMKVRKTRKTLLSRSVLHRVARNRLSGESSTSAESPSGVPDAFSPPRHPRRRWNIISPRVIPSGLADSEANSSEENSDQDD